jgi:uncharacterized membrane-anchored protein
LRFIIESPHQIPSSPSALADTEHIKAAVSETFDAASTIPTGFDEDQNGSSGKLSIEDAIAGSYAVCLS